MGSLDAYANLALAGLDHDDANIIADGDLFALPSCDDEQLQSSSGLQSQPAVMARSRIDITVLGSPM